MRVAVRHWLPIVTFCPVNHLPDLIYVTVVFDGDDVNELYAVRKRIRKICSMQKDFMENIARAVFIAFPTAKEVQVNLAFMRHSVTITRNNNV